MLTCDAFLTNGRHSRVPDDVFLLNGLRHASDFRRTVRVLCPATLFQEQFLHNGPRFAPHFRWTVRVLCWWKRISDERFTFCAPPPFSRNIFCTTVYVVHRISDKRFACCVPPPSSTSISARRSTFCVAAVSRALTRSLRPGHKGATSVQDALSWKPACLWPALTSKQFAFTPGPSKYRLCRGPRGPCRLQICEFGFSSPAGWDLAG